MKRSRSPVDEDFVDEGRPTFKIVKRYVNVCSSSQSSFFDATTIEEVMAT